MCEESCMGPFCHPSWMCASPWQLWLGLCNVSCTVVNKKETSGRRGVGVTDWLVSTCVSSPGCRSVWCAATRHVQISPFMLFCSACHQQTSERLFLLLLLLFSIPTPVHQCFCLYHHGNWTCCIPPRSGGFLFFFFHNVRPNWWLRWSASLQPTPLSGSLNPPTAPHYWRRDYITPPASVWTSWHVPTKHLKEIQELFLYPVAVWFWGHKVSTLTCTDDIWSALIGKKMGTIRSQRSVHLTGSKNTTRFCSGSPTINYRLWGSLVYKFMSDHMSVDQTQHKWRGTPSSTLPLEDPSWLQVECQQMRGKTTKKKAGDVRLH